MNYHEWLTTIPKEFTEESLWKMEAYPTASVTVMLDELLTNVPLPPEAT